MGCCGRSRKAKQYHAEQKWEYINLNDFKAKGCLTVFAYGYLWFSLLISVAVYTVDTFTAVNLLVLNNWTSQIKPDIDLDIAKWVFSICIILSFINLAFEQIRAWRVMRRGNIAECYLDNLAARLESTRLGKGQGYRRFLVFAELTKSKKGAEYVALFTYFSLQAWIRVLICSGPRQVINVFTIKALYVADLNPGAEDVEGSLVGFFENLSTLATEDYQKALVLAGMCFTLVVWIFSLLFMILAIFAYVFFLWHWIPRADGGLAGYCERKVNKTLVKIVSKKVNKALRQEEEKRMKDAFRTGPNDVQMIDRKATLPTLPNVGSGKADALPQMPTLPNLEAKPSMPSLERKDTMGTVSTLPAYTSRPSNTDIELNPLENHRQTPPRSRGTPAPQSGYSANASLLSNAQDMAYSNSPPGPSSLGPSAQMNRPQSPFIAPPRRPAGPSATMDHGRSQSPAPTMASSQYPLRQQTQSPYYANSTRPSNGSASVRQPGPPQYGDINMARTQSPAPYGQPPNRQPTIPNMGPGNIPRSQSPATFGQQPRQPTLPNILPEPTLPTILPEPTLPGLDFGNMARTASPSPHNDMARTASPNPFNQEPRTFTPFNPNGQTAQNTATPIAELGSNSPPRPTRSGTATQRNDSTPIAELATGSPPRPSRAATDVQPVELGSNSPPRATRSQTSPFDVFAAGDGRQSPDRSVMPNTDASSHLQNPNPKTNVISATSSTLTGFRPFTPSMTESNLSQAAAPQSQGIQRPTGLPMSHGYTGSGYGSDYFQDYRESTQSSAFDLEHYDLERQGDQRR
ncbi:putative vacuolar membrane protein YJR054W [Ceratocystis fimbriata CBS 114723]|uniref:Putative vacuolar membrane protein YJR054W n=1 Tax=Ceratocystis fimbriata CBS 114723 TaxID=1035309 RepID=A0A2C5X9U7_9PEZI|nr:putative vacuolar membrane protein YJR054W [Ceratocystis fimbriata CBS 114723]